MTLSISSCYHPSLASIPRQQHCIKKAGQWCVKVLDKHTDLISSFSILALNACILGSKIFKSIPFFLPRLSSVILNVGGVIWLNIQMRDCLKSCQDFKNAISIRDYSGMLFTASKVAVKASDILLISGLFVAALIALVNFPAVTLTMYAIMRPIALTSLVAKIALDISDYFINKRLLQRLDVLQRCENKEKITAIMQSFIDHLKKENHKNEVPLQEKKLAIYLIRQLKSSTLEIKFQEQASFQLKHLNSSNTLDEKYAMELFSKVKQSMEDKQTMTKANLGLTALGYAIMGVNRIYPDTLLQSSLTFFISFLYTIKLIKQKWSDYS